MDFVNCIERDTSVEIFSALEDPLDIIAASAVSRSWREIVISNRCIWTACLKKFPQLSRVDHVCEPSCNGRNPKTFAPEGSIEWENLEKEHRVYAYLVRAATKFPIEEYMVEACLASSTDNFPVESIYNTLEPADLVGDRPSYWSSTGQDDPAVPETLLYKLVDDMCIITEIDVQPFQAYFQRGSPIYSAKFVRFRMGHPKSVTDDPFGEAGDISIDDNLVWTYTSPHFPMAQENRSQKFTLPQPVLCFGGYLQIELLGRVQRQEVDDLFYICISHVKIMGRSLDGAFGVEKLEPSGKFVLAVLSYTPPPPVTENTDAAFG